MRLLPLTPRGTWLLAGIVWVIGAASTWTFVTRTPCAAWKITSPVRLVGFLADGTTLATLDVPKATDPDRQMWRYWNPTTGTESTDSPGIGMTPHLSSDGEAILAA